MKIVLIGDSTLDNVVWLKDPKKCIKYLLEQQLSEFEVHNYAADGFTTEDVLNGCYPSISKSFRDKVGDPFPNFDKNFKPLTALKNLQNVSYVVISCGGNDIREILGNIHLLQEKMIQLNKNIPQIIKRCLEVTPKIIVQFQYRPCYIQQNYGVYQAIDKVPGEGDSIVKLNKLMETIYPTVFQLAQQYNLALIDLPQTFDIYDGTLYVNQIEPSSKGGQIISELITFVVKNHQFDKNQKSKIYRKQKDQIIAEEIGSQFKWKINI